MRESPAPENRPPRKGDVISPNVEPATPWVSPSSDDLVKDPNVSSAAEQLAERQQGLVDLQISALRITANVVVITDHHGAIEWANQAFSAITGYSLAEAVGNRVGDLINSGTHDAAFFREMWETLLAGRVWQGDIVNRRKDGSLYEEESTITPITNDAGQMTHFIAVKQDITQRRLLESKMRQAQKMEAVGQLAGGIAHDFNNILAAVLIHLGLLRDDPAIEERTRLALRELELEVQRGAGLTRQLLTFSRQQAMEPQTLDPHEIISGLLKMLRRLLGEHINLQLVGSTPLPLIHADPGMVEQVVINLCVNARDAMPKGGNLTLSTLIEEFSAPSSRFPDTLPGRYVGITVTDDGCGMDQKTLQHIFEPFFTTKSAGRGTGLGLATVYGIAKQHHGWVDVESVPGKGSSFHVFFPVAEAHSPRTTTAAEAPQPRGHGETILVTEDEANVRTVLCLSLRRHGYKVVEAASGPAALQCWREHQGQFDLLFTDMVMPEGLSGREIADRMRIEKPDLKVILCTGYSRTPGVSPVEPGAGMILLQKPFDVSQLLTAVRNCLDHS